ncbi:MAG TPA: PAS domain S-box protein, partial [Aquabacterium sp.]|nr:PAS domain S-box protein [Aquabacterium sp.]
MAAKSRPLVWSLLIFMFGLLGTTLMSARQQKVNEATTQSQFAIQASENANRIVERIYRFQYGLRGIQGAILGADTRHLSDNTFLAFRSARGATLEFNGARGFGYMHESPSPDGPTLTSPFHETLEDTAANELSALVQSAAAQRAAKAAWTNQAPTLSGPIHPGLSPQDLMVLLPAQPRSAGSSPPGWVYVVFTVDAALIDLLPQGTDYVLTIKDVTPGTHGGSILSSRLGGYQTWPLRWQSTREVLGRRWLIEAHADSRFARAMNLTRPSTIGWIGLGLSALMGILAFALASSRQRRVALRRQEAQLAAIVRHTSDAIVSHDLGGRILSWNQAAERIFGVGAKDMVGRTWSRLMMSTWDEAQDRQLIESVISGQAVSNIDTVLRADDGTPIDVSMSIVSLSEDGEQGATICRTIRDNRDRKAAEARLRDLASDLEHQVQRRTAELDSATRHLQSVLDGMPSMIGYWDHDLVNRFANRAYANWLKAPQGFVVGLHMESVLGPRGFEAIRPHVEAVLRGQSQTFEHTEANPDGTEQRHLQSHFLPDLEGEVVKGFYVLIHDVTALTESQQKLAVASHQSEALLETIRLHGIYSVTDRHGVIVDVNDAFCQISGYTREELIGNTHHIVNAGVHPKSFWAEMWRSISKGRPWRGEVCNRAKDGSLYWVDSIVAGFRGADGRIEKYISLRTDVTARKLAEERLRASSEGFLERAGQMAGVGGWELDLATGDMVLTRQTRAIFGVDESRRL